MDTNTIGRKVALWSLLINALVALVHTLINDASSIFIYLYAWIICSVLGNGFVIIYTLLRLFIDKTYSKSIITIALLPLNISILPLIEYYNKRLPIEFVNSTGKLIEDVKIYKNNIIEYEMKELAPFEELEYSFNKFEATNINLRYTIDGAEVNDSNVIWVNTDRPLTVNIVPITYNIGQIKRIYVD
ncbi:MAG: hypothetical protein ACO1PI_05365 [Bacteroidota bacterium]